MKKKIVVIAGTRPEAIKTVSVVRALRALPDFFDVVLCASGQHREMLPQALADFGLRPDINLDVMTEAQTLSVLSSRLFLAVDELYLRENPAAVLVQGDTTTVQVAALAAFYRHIPVGHIEAGLRSHNIAVPFPEELNRRVVGLAASWHFAPTGLARRNLLAEQIPEENILVTGNTVIDALLWMRELVRVDAPLLPAEAEEAIARNRRIILVTGHRRESFGEGFRNICRALLEISRRFPEDRLIYPVHLNPNVRGVVNELLAGAPGIILCPPLTYKPFVRLMDSSYLILTDSGGIQEEGPSLGKPVLVMRELTERPEGVEAGVNILVGTTVEKILETTTRLLSDREAYQSVAAIKNPYGDGRSGERIAQFLRNRLERFNIENVETLWRRASPPAPQA
ncbi:MAG: UDP-N-acetylglucosamine 2-epimerase (non-hydrolyzing) [Deltaproteobacteria bacterium]|jgi:UDP-N-acetylglucosamine 2-epimerase|nr:UDP-N-acetylglucosamine 2-epimerase (non-hydrolyzing) [Deltaproteobacteria bacterium]